MKLKTRNIVKHDKYQWRFAFDTHLSCTSEREKMKPNKVLYLSGRSKFAIHIAGHWSRTSNHFSHVNCATTDQISRWTIAVLNLMIACFLDNNKQPYSVYRGILGTASEGAFPSCKRSKREKARANYLFDLFSKRWHVIKNAILLGRMFHLTK